MMVSGKKSRVLPAEWDRRVLKSSSDSEDSILVQKWGEKLDLRFDRTSKLASLDFDFKGFFLHELEDSVESKL